MASSSALANLELLIVSNDYSTLKMFTSAWRETGSRLDSTPSIACANDLVTNRKIHGIVVDMGVKGAPEFISQLKKSRGQGAPVIVACTSASREEKAALDAGANFVVQRPFSTGRVFDLLTLGRRIPEPQRRGSLRHKLVAPVTIFTDGLQYRALISDLSECGMSIRSLPTFAPNTALQFLFDVHSSAAVVGQGKVIWTNADGYAGISFDSVRCSNSLPFAHWLDKHGVMLKVQPLAFGC